MYLIDAPLGIFHVPLQVPGPTHRLAAGVDHAARLEERHTELGVADDGSDAQGSLDFPQVVDALEALGGGDQLAVFRPQELNAPFVDDAYQIVGGERIGHRCLW